MHVQKRWLTKEEDIDALAHLQDTLHIHPALCKILYHRGISTYEQAKAFFRPELSNLHNPFLMNDMKAAVERIIYAIHHNERILIYGDYDVDGTTSVALVYSYLRSMYENIDYYIPDRYKEGYGISTSGIDYAYDNEVKLIIALDCGIRAHDKVDYAHERKIDFIICDHHLPEDVLPDAVAVLDPKRFDNTYPFTELSGCGIGFKLMQALCLTMERNMEEVYELLDLVAVSIASDLVHLVDENRIMAYHGLKQFNKNKRAGFAALKRITAFNRDADITDLVFIIGPRINAAGRIAHGSEAVELLIEKDILVAYEKVQKIQLNNDERKGLDKDITEEAISILEDEYYARRKSTVLFQSHWHKGVIGIVASRLIERHYKPTIILTESNGKAVGSGRSIHGFDLHQALDACKDYIIQFGGHKYAAGLTLELDMVPIFIQKFEEYVNENITTEIMTPFVDIDAEIELSDITPKFYNILQQMAPFGPMNMRPIFLTKDVKDAGYTQLLKDEHLKLHITKSGQRSVFGIGFGMWYLIPIIRNNTTFNVCYHLYENEWNGNKRIELQVKDIQA